MPSWTRNRVSVLVIQSYRSGHPELLLCVQLTSLLGTLYLAYQPQRLFNRPATERSLRYNTDFILDVESAGGRGISQALGLAGFTNLDVVRNPNLGSTPYIARVQLHQTTGFTNEMTAVLRGPLSLASKAPVRRIEIRIGKMSMPDVFDIDGILSDSHLQFTNWTIDNNGAWDYAADTRGYTYVATVEYQDRNWAVRYESSSNPGVTQLEPELGTADTIGETLLPDRC